MHGQSANFFYVSRQPGPTSALAPGYAQALQLQPFCIIHVKTEKGLGGQFLWVMWMAEEGGRNDTGVNTGTHWQLKIWPLVSVQVLCLFMWLFTISLVAVEPGTSVGELRADAEARLSLEQNTGRLTTAFPQCP